MPKGLLLLILLLLIGGYYFLAGNHGTHVSPIPSFEGSAKVVPGSKGYTVVLSGKLHLPAEQEYTTNSLKASLVVDGVAIKSEPLSTATVKGPSDFPVSYSPTIPSNASSVAIRIDANVQSGDNIYVFSTEVPVALPDKSLLAKEPSVDVSVGSVTLVGSTKDVDLVIRVYNPNKSAISFNSFKLTFGSTQQDVPISSISANGSSSGSVSLSLPASATTASFSISASYTVNGQKFTLSRSFDINVPILSEQPLTPSFSASYESLTSSGYRVHFKGSLSNPNDFPITLDKLHVILTAGDVSQDVNLLSGKAIMPESNVSFDGSAMILSLFSNATAKLVAEYDGKEHVLGAFPVGVANPSAFLNGVSAKLLVSVDTNASKCIITPYLTNQNDFAVDLNGVKISSDRGTKSYDLSTLSASENKALDALEVNATGQPLDVTISGVYGIKSMGVWVPLSYSAEFNC